MKTFLLLSVLLFSSISKASYTPIVEVTIGNDNGIYLAILNDSPRDLVCKYNISWLAGLSYRLEFGDVEISSLETIEFSYKNPSNIWISGIKANAVCE